MLYGPLQLITSSCSDPHYLAAAEEQRDGRWTISLRRARDGHVYFCQATGVSAAFGMHSVHDAVASLHAWVAKDAAQAAEWRKTWSFPRDIHCGYCGNERELHARGEFCFASQRKALAR